jgi:hypothetical protein
MVVLLGQGATLHAGETPVQRVVHAPGNLDGPPVLDRHLDATERVAEATEGKPLLSHPSRRLGRSRTLSTSIKPLRNQAQRSCRTNRDVDGTSSSLSSAQSRVDSENRPSAATVIISTVPVRE